MDHLDLNIDKINLFNTNKIKLNLMFFFWLDLMN